MEWGDGMQEYRKKQIEISFINNADHIFMVKIANTKDYSNNDILHHENIYLPTSYEKIAQALSNIGLEPNTELTEYRIEEVLCYGEKLKDVVTPHEDIYKLNEYASVLSKMKHTLYKKFMDEIEVRDDIQTLSDLIIYANEELSKNTPMTEKDYRVSKNMVNNCEADSAVTLAHRIDEFLRHENTSYSRCYADIEKACNELVKNILNANTFVVKCLLNSKNTTMCSQRTELLNSLIQYEIDFMKNLYSLYRLKHEYVSQCGDDLQSMRNNQWYINRDMYDLIYSGTLGSTVLTEPMAIENSLIMEKISGGINTPKPKDVIVINFNGDEKAYFRERENYVEAPEFNGIQIKSAAISNYKGLMAFVSTENKVYMGKNERFLYNRENGYLPYYNNSDNSIIFISNNKNIFPFITGAGWSLSQQEMIDKHLFKKRDYKEFAQLKKTILSGFTAIQEVKFADMPFSYPDYGKAYNMGNNKVHEKGGNKMLNFPSREEVESLRAEYPKGTRISLVKMDDPYSKLQPGDRGTVNFVDDAGNIDISWDIGEGLSIAYGEDECRKLTQAELDEEAQEQGTVQEQSEEGQTFGMG